MASSSASTIVGTVIAVSAGMARDVVAAYPDLDPGVRLTKVPSLDLYREPDPFRTPKLAEIRDLIDVEEVLTMWTAGFPEPRTFSKRVARLFRDRVQDFDVVHDNQVLGSALLDLEERVGLPLVTTIHHPISIDRRIDLASAPNRRKRLTLRRWYSFTNMQTQVASLAVDQYDATGGTSAPATPLTIAELVMCTRSSIWASS